MNSCNNDDECDNDSKYTDEKMEMDHLSTCSVTEPKKAVEDEEEEICPLFIDGLPKNFSKHSGLAAIASLLQDEEALDGDSKDDKRYSSIAKKTNTYCDHAKGGGKIDSIRRQSRTRRMKNHNNSPYNLASRTTTQKKVLKRSIAETQVFFKTWKL